MGEKDDIGRKIIFEADTLPLEQPFRPTVCVCVGGGGCVYAGGDQKIIYPNMFINNIKKENHKNIKQNYYCQKQPVIS